MPFAKMSSSDLDLPIALQIHWVEYAQAQAQIRQIRDRVFVQEQQIAPELEFDGEDETAEHSLALYARSAIATLRLRPYTANTVKLERLAVLPEFRGQGIGQALTSSAIARARQQNYQHMVLHAQTYIAELYRKLGFSIVGEPFLEAQIPHIKMVRSLSKE
jgi:predicted GNAT family N-acyltransferase